MGVQASSAALWAHLKSTRFNMTSFSFESWHFWSFCYSPINQDLLNMGQTIARSKLTYRGWRRYSVAVRTYCQDDWTKAVHLPAELARCIKRYHSAGNGFILYFVWMNLSLLYVFIKVMFHEFVTGHDEALAKYYADHYFPRLYESYTNPSKFYSALMTMITLYVIERSIMAIKLIRKSVDNKDGYRHIDAIQLNALFLTVLNWNIGEWWRFLKAARKHRGICTASHHGHDHVSAAMAQERAAHLHVSQRLADTMDELDNYELFYRHNAIDFSNCYRFHHLDISRQRPGTLYPTNAFCRIDLPELSWFIYYFFFGVPVLVSAMVLFLTIGFWIELIQVVPKGEQVTIYRCIRSIPDLLTDFRYLVRFMDIVIVVIAQMPLQNQTSAIGIDIAALISRINKVTDLLRDDLELCTSKAHAYDISHSDTLGHESDLAMDVYTEPRTGRHCLDFSDSDDEMYLSRFGTHFDNMSKSERDSLCKRLKVNLRLAHLVRTEFVAIKESHSNYLDLLIAGSGFCIASAVAVSLLVPPSLELFILYAAVLSGTVQLVVLLPLCGGTENSLKNLYMTLIKLMPNEGGYIKNCLVKVIILEAHQNERSNDRAFCFIGQYPISPTTIGPYFAYLATCILIVSKLLFG